MSMPIQRQSEQFGYFDDGPRFARDRTSTDLPRGLAALVNTSGPRIQGGMLNTRTAVNTDGMHPDDHAYHTELPPGRGGEVTWVDDAESYGRNPRREYNPDFGYEPTDEDERRQEGVAEDDESGYNWGPEPRRASRHPFDREAGWADDNPSYDDTMKHIDDTLSAGEPFPGGDGFLSGTPRIPSGVGEGDDWQCSDCGNTPDSGGFFPALNNGTLIEPTHDSGWDGHYACGDCGKVIGRVAARRAGRTAGAWEDFFGDEMPSPFAGRDPENFFTDWLERGPRPGENDDPPRGRKGALSRTAACLECGGDVLPDGGDWEHVDGPSEHDAEPDQDDYDNDDYGMGRDPAQAMDEFKSRREGRRVAGSDQLDELTQRKALNLVKGWMGRHMAGDEDEDLDIPSGQRAYESGEGLKLHPSWTGTWQHPVTGEQVEDESGPSPAILHEGVHGWADDASFDDDLNDRLRGIGVQTGNWYGNVLTLHPYKEWSIPAHAQRTSAAEATPQDPAMAPQMPVGGGFLPGHRVGLDWRDRTIPGTVIANDGQVHIRWDEGQYTSEDPTEVRLL